MIGPIINQSILPVKKASAGIFVYMYHKHFVWNSRSFEWIHAKNILPIRYQNNCDINVYKNETDKQ